MSDIDTSTTGIPVHLRDRVRIIVHPGATRTIVRRKSKDDPPICTGIPAIHWDGRNYTRYDISEGTGISHSMISKIFAGTRKPSLSSAIRLAKFFDCSVDTLLAQVLPRVEIKSV